MMKEEKDSRNELGGEETEPAHRIQMMEETGSVTLPLLEEKNGTLEVAGQVIWEEGWYAL